MINKKFPYCNELNRMTIAVKRNPKLWEKAKSQACRSANLCDHSARKMQWATKYYKDHGGTYEGRKRSSNSLKKWSNQKWRTSDGTRSGGKKRYLPDKAWKSLTDEQKRRTNRAKLIGYKQGKQFVPQPNDVARIAARVRKKTPKRSRSSPRTSERGRRRKSAVARRSRSSSRRRRKPSTRRSRSSDTRRHSSSVARKLFQSRSRSSARKSPVGSTEYMRRARAKAKSLGVTVVKSSRKGKKLDVMKNGKRVASIGAIGYDDFLSHGDPERRRRYKIRHEKNRHIVGSAGYYADRILW